MQKERIINITGSKPVRPVMMTVLCILTFAGSGLNALSNLMVSVFYDLSMKFASEMIRTLKIPGMDLFLSARPVYFIVTAAINILAFAGAIMMWNLRRTGFHLYTIAQILVILAPMYFFRFPGPDIFSIILGSIFVLLYGSNLKVMN